MKDLFKQGLGTLDEFIHTVAYVGFVFSAILILFNILPVNEAIVYMIFLIFHILTIAVFGILKEFFYEKNFAIRFVFANLMLTMIFCIMFSAITTILLILSLAIIGALYILFTERLICITASKNRPLLERTFEKAPKFYFCVLLAMPIIAVVIPAVLLPCSAILKVILIIAYIVSIPFISLAADNGFNIEEIFDL